MLSPYRKLSIHFQKECSCLQKFHKIGVHFQLSQKRRLDLMDLSEKFNGPKIKFQMAYNETRVSAQRGFLLSVARLNKGIKGYMTEHPRELPEVSNDEWDSLAEFASLHFGDFWFSHNYCPG